MLTFHATRHEAISAAKQAARNDDKTYYACLVNDGSYIVMPRKMVLSNANGTHDVIRVDSDGMTYPD